MGACDGKTEREVVRVAKHLSDKKRKQIITDYIECGVYREVARKHGIAPGTVRKIVTNGNDIEQKITQKKEQNTLDMLAFMDSRKGTAQLFVDVCLQYLFEPEKLEKAKLSEITTAMGTVIDKFTVTAQNDMALQKLDEMITRIDIAAKGRAGKNE